MDFRFNSFYQDGLHPYVEAMNNILGSRSNASQISSLLLSLLPSTNEKLKHDAQYLQQVAQEVVQHRRDNRTDKNDLLNSMIYGKDPKTGQTMREALIAANMQTFLIAGS
jgi:cytochrome P450/NADPH-cytochrome P450 reductase